MLLNVWRVANATDSMREDLLLLWVYAGDSILSVQVSLGPGNFVPSTGEMKLAVSIS